MSSDKDKIEFFCEQNNFDPKLVPKYIKFVFETFDSFLQYSDIVYEMKRTSHAFQTITKFHLEAMKDKGYQKQYEGAIEAVANRLKGE